MRVVVDSGSTKSHWKLITLSNQEIDFETQGLNPFQCSADLYADVIESSFPKSYDISKVANLYFYGSGCIGNENISKVTNALNALFINATIEVYSDIIGAARALFENNTGIVLILGSGANAGYYNGKDVLRITPSLGYVLGDEGSGAYLGKELIKYWLYNELPKDLTQKFERYKDFDASKALLKVYSEPFPNKFLASLVPFLSQNMHHPFVIELVDTAFEKLYKQHLGKIEQFKVEPTGVVGSVGFIFKQNLKEVIEKHGGNLEIAIQHPISRLVKYHYY